MPYSSGMTDLAAPAATGAGGDDELVRRLLANRQRQATPMVFNGPNAEPAPPAPMPGVPLVFNGPTMATPAAPPGNGSPVRDDVVRAMGGRDGQMPSMNQFLAGMPQSTQMQFGSGQGQIGNGLGIGGPLTQGYQPAFQGPEQRSDHTAAGMNAYGHLLGQYTMGPESPTQALARVNQAMAHSMEANARYRPGGLAERETAAHEQRANWEMSPERALMEYARGGLATGLDRDTVASDVGFLRGLSGGRPAVPGAPPAPAGGLTALPPPPDPRMEELNRHFRDAVSRYVTQPAVPGSRAAHAPTLAGASPENIDKALTLFVGSLPQEHLQTPEAINRLRDFIVAPGRFGPADFDRWFQARRGWFPSADQEAQQRAVDRLIAARNQVDPANPIGYEVRGSGGALSALGRMLGMTR